MQRKINIKLDGENHYIIQMLVYFLKMTTEKQKHDNARGSQVRELN